MKIEIVCPTCGGAAWRERNHVNRAKKIGAPVYCNAICAGIARRKNKTIEQKKAEKRDYDRDYHLRNLDRILESKRLHHKRTYDPAKAAIARKARMHLHVAYCRRPEYKKWKKAYDKIYDAKKRYGPLWEVFRLTQDILKEVHARADDVEIRRANGTLNKKYDRRIRRGPSPGPHG